MKKSVERQEAIDAGRLFYFTGKPCKRGHIVERRCSTKVCVKCSYELGKIYYKKFPEKGRARAALFRKRHPERIKASSKKWIAKNLDKKAKNQNARRARLAGAVGAYTTADLDRILLLQNYRCAMPWCRRKLKKTKTGVYLYQTDHIIPISNGGSNYPSNIQITCNKGCNQKKKNKDPIMHAQDNGFML